MKSARPFLLLAILMLFVIAFVQIGFSSPTTGLILDDNGVSIPVSKTRLDTTPKTAEQEYYELRIYKIYDYDKQRAAEAYLENALVPALNRMGLDRVGVFTNKKDENDHSIFVLIPFPTIEKFAQLNATLAADKEYQEAAASYFARKKKDPVFDRIESRFMKAFAGIPVIEVPALTKEKKDRIFELRLYQSHTEDHARRKVKMFNEGEIDLMRKVELGPVFYGETLIGPDVPNLVYMLSASDEEAHKAHFKAFLQHPEWERMKTLEEYKDTVSKIQNWFLAPTKYSQL